MFRNILLVSVLLAAVPVHAALRVFACEPEWAALVTELAPDADVAAATTGFQDPHYIQARPGLIAKVRRADLVVCAGADLEVGWLPLLLRQSSNAGVQPGQPGYFEAAMQVERLEVPTSVDRAEGDLHPYGNPHVQLDPNNITLIAAALVERLAQLDPAGAEGYRSRGAAFDARWRQAIVGWEARAEPLRGARILSHHRSWIYLYRWLGIVDGGELEPKPGIPPTTSHLSELLTRLQGATVRAIIRSAYQDARGSEWLAGRTGIPAIVLPNTVRATDGATDLFSWYDDIITRLLEAGER